MDLDIFDYKDIPLYVVDIPYGLNRSHREYFTRIPWGEYKRIRFAERVQSLDPWELKIKIFRDYTVRSVKWDEADIGILPAGIVDTVANLIMYVSDSGIIPDRQGKININAFNGRLNMYRNIANSSVEYQMYTIICLVFRAYTFEMLDKLPFDRISSLFASAERYLIENGIIKERLTVYNPEEKTKTDSPAPPPKKPTDEASILEQFLKLKRREKEEAEVINIKIPAPSDQEMKEYKSAQRQQSRINQNIVPDPPPRVQSEPPRQIKQTESEQVYYPPKDEYVVSNGVTVKVPGITIDKSSNSGGFKDEDFAAPLMSDEQAMALHLEMGLPPAGYEFMLERYRAEEEASMAQEKKPIGKKRFKRK